MKITAVDSGVGGLDPDQGDAPLKMGARGLSRSVSMKAAVDHYKEHKWKYIALKVAIGLAIGLGVGLGIAYAVYRASGRGFSLTQKKAAVLGTEIPSVSAVPAKGKQTTRRMLEGTRLHLRRLVADDQAVDPANLPSACDYNVAEADYVVNDKATDAAQMVNEISCYISQLRIADIAINATLNPNRMPYRAMVDMGRCQSKKSNGEGGSQASMWTVNTVAPASYGEDGLYTSKVSFNMQLFPGFVDVLHGTLRNTLSGGQLQRSNFYFTISTMISGFVDQDFSDASNTKIKYAMSTWGSLKYINAEFNPTTMVGKAITGSKDTSDGSDFTYKLAFSDNAILKQTTDNSVPTTTTKCLDFSYSGRKLFGDQYLLYHGSDGSLAASQQGFPISSEIAGYSEPVQAYASYWGLWASYGRKSDGEYEDTTSKWVDGMKVTKQNYDARGTATDYTLKLVNAKLQKVSAQSLTFDELKGYPLTVDNWRSTGPPFTIAWDGTKLVTLGENVNSCFDWSNSKQSFVELAEGVKINSYSDCRCLYRASDSDPYTRKSSGAFDQSSYLSKATKGEAPLDTPVEFIPTVTDYPQGIYVYSKDYTFNGQIKLEYETVMSLYNVKEGSFTKGDAVSQPSTGATGTVYETTKSRIFGLDGFSMTLAQSYVSSWSSDCSISSSSGSAYWFDAGTILTQKQATTTGSGIKGASTVIVLSVSSLKKGMLVTCATQVVATGSTTTAGNKAVLVTSATGIAVGMSVSGSELSLGSVVTAVSSNTVTLNYVATATSSGAATLTFGCVVPSETYVTAIESVSKTITLSKPLSATFSSVSLDFLVAGIAPESWGGWGGLPVVVRDGSEGTFDLINVITVSSPDSSSHKVSGTIPWKSSGGTGVSDSWDDYGVTSAGSGCPAGSALALSWSGVKKSNGAAIATVFASWTGSTTTTITLATASDASAIAVGDTVSGPGIASNTTVNLVNGAVITLSKATEHASRVAVKIGSRVYYCSFDSTSSPLSLEIHSWNFYEYSWTTNTYTDHIKTGDSVSGEGIPLGAKVGTYSRSDTGNKIPLVNSDGSSVTPISVLKSRVTFGAPSFTAYSWSWSGDGGVNSLYYDSTAANKGSECTGVAVRAVDCANAPTIKMSCQRAIRATSTTVKVKLSSPTSTRFKSCYWWIGENCDIAVGAALTNFGGPGWVWSEVGAVVPVSASTKVIYTTQSVVTAGQTVPTLLCSSGASQCPRGDRVSAATSTSSSSSLSSSNLYYDAPSMLSSTVQKSESGQCSASAKTGVFTTVYSGIEGSPAINIDWETTPTYDDDGKSIWSVRFLKLASRGKSCNSPKITFSGPKIKATFSSSSNDNKITVTAFTSGRLSPGMEVTATAGFATNTSIVFCTSYNTTPATCTLNKAVSSTQSVAVDVTGAPCVKYPTATLSCDSNDDVVSLPQAYSYTFNSATGLLTDATSTTGGPLLASASSSSSFYFNGPFFEGTDANKQLLACDWDSSITCPWKASQVLSEYYSYETGKYVSRVSLIDSAGKPIEFDQPQLVRYQHVGSASNSKNSYDGTTMLLRYDGPGQLSGLPLICFDESMEEVACVTMGRQSTTNYADIVVPDNVALTNIIDGRKYYAKPKTLIERYPISSDASICNSLSVASVPAPITASETVAPSGLLDSGSYPSESELEKTYFMGGKPAAVAGVTLYELQAAAA